MRKKLLKRASSILISSNSRNILRKFPDLPDKDSLHTPTFPPLDPAILVSTDALMYICLYSKVPPRINIAEIQIQDMFVHMAGRANEVKDRGGVRGGEVQSSTNHHNLKKSLQMIHHMNIDEYCFI